MCPVTTVYVAIMLRLVSDAIRGEKYPEVIARFRLQELSTEKNNAEKNGRSTLTAAPGRLSNL